MKKHIASFIHAAHSSMKRYNRLMLDDTGHSPGSVRVTWLGTAGAFMTDGTTGILIDPYVSRFGWRTIAFGSPLEPKHALVREWAARLGGEKTAAVIVSHSHFDHAADAPCFSLETGAPLIGTESTINIGRGSGVPEGRLISVKPGQTMKFGNFTVRFVESAHGPAFLGRIPYPGTIDNPLVPPAPANRYRLGGVFSLLVSHPSGTILHHGSAGFLPGMYDGIRADAVLLGITGREDTDTYLKQVALKTGARLVIPIHQDNFTRPLENGMSFLPTAGFGEFCACAEKYRDAFSLRTLPMGKAVRILPLNDDAAPRGPIR